MIKIEKTPLFYFRATLVVLIFLALSIYLSIYFSCCYQQEIKSVSSYAHVPLDSFDSEILNISSILLQGYCPNKNKLNILLCAESEGTDEQKVKATRILLSVQDCKCF